MSEYFKKLSTERSTWLGLISFFGALGYAFSPIHVDLIVNTAIGLSGLVFGVMPDPEKVK